MKPKYLSAYIATFASISLTFASGDSRGSLTPKFVTVTHTIEPLVVPTTQVPTVGPIRNLRFVLFEQGIRPNELRIKTGLVNISMEDKTNDSQGLLVLQVLAGERVSFDTITKTANHWRGRKLLRLLPGTYELHDTSRPANKATLVVEP